jgi:RimJ/RimL family protein N-acetyltransferase
LEENFEAMGLPRGRWRTFWSCSTCVPLYAYVAKDNIPSIWVLEKCGFIIRGEHKEFANARGAEVEQFILELAADEKGEAR